LPDPLHPPQAPKKVLLAASRLSQETNPQPQQQQQQSTPGMGRTKSTPRRLDEIEREREELEKNTPRYRLPVSDHYSRGFKTAPATATQSANRSAWAPSHPTTPSVTSPSWPPPSPGTSTVSKVVIAGPTDPRPQYEFGKPSPLSGGVPAQSYEVSDQEIVQVAAQAEAIPPEQN